MAKIRIIQVGDKYKVQEKIWFFWMTYRNLVDGDIIYDELHEAEYAVEEYLSDKKKPKVIKEYHG